MQRALSLHRDCGINDECVQRCFDASTPEALTDITEWQTCIHNTCPFGSLECVLNRCGRWQWPTCYGPPIGCASAVTCLTACTTGDVVCASAGVYQLGSWYAAKSYCALAECLNANRALGCQDELESCDSGSIDPWLCGNPA